MTTILEATTTTITEATATTITGATTADITPPIFTFPPTTGWASPGITLSTTTAFTTTSTAIIIPDIGAMESVGTLERENP